MDKNLQIIFRNFPDLEKTNYKVLSSGNSNLIYVFNNKAFRFSRGEEKTGEVKAKFLKEFHKISPITVPNLEVHFDNDTSAYFESFDFIKGVSFDPKLVDKFSKQELMEIAKKLGEFLTVLHSFSKDKAKEMGIGEADPNTFWEYLEDTAYPESKNRVKDHLSKEELEWVDKLFLDHIELIKSNPYPTRVIHSDMWTFHIIVDPDKKTLSGVIDFALRIHDPAHDFKPFIHYGKDFLDEVYRNYKLERDKDFDKRREYYTGFDLVFELGRSIEQNNEEKMNYSAAKLTEYPPESSSVNHSSPQQAARYSGSRININKKLLQEYIQKNKS